MSKFQKDHFLAACDKLRTLTGDEKPEWGLMSPQHMVEHLVGAWRVSNGRARVKCIFEGEALEKRRAFVFSDTPYKRNITNPVQGDGLGKLRKPDYKSAVDQLEDEMQAFFLYHETNPNAVETHPVFGDLDYDGWLTFQAKHMGHHLAQFNLSLA